MSTFKYPQIKTCPFGPDDEAECLEEHNPLPGYEEHHYGCECEGCVQWYWLLGS